VELTDEECGVDGEEEYLVMTVFCMVKGVVRI
jgi:hypothetical protein